MILERLEQFYPDELTEDERETVRAQVAAYHRDYELIRKGDLYRLVSPFENPYRAVWEIVSPEKDRALLTMVTMRMQLHAHVAVRLRGLDPAKYYKNETTGEVLSGAALMRAGIILTQTAIGDGESCTVYFTAVEKN